MNSKKVIFYVGLPGSGKTYHAKKAAKKLKGFLIDDINSSFQMKTALEDHDTIIITSPKLCHKADREFGIKIIKEISEDIEIEWIYFENDPEKCLRNIAFRNDGRLVENYIQYLTKIYRPPENALKIWQP